MRRTSAVPAFGSTEAATRQWWLPRFDLKTAKFFYHSILDNWSIISLQKFQFENFSNLPDSLDMVQIFCQEKTVKTPRSRGLL